MVSAAEKRGFSPKLVAFDSWSSSPDNLKRVRDCGWHWLTQLKSNRLVNATSSANRPISTCFIPPHGRKVHLKGYGWVLVFRTVTKNGDFEI